MLPVDVMWCYTNLLTYLLKISQMGISSNKFCTLGRKFSDKLKFKGGAELLSVTLRRRQCFSASEALHTALYKY